MGPKKIFHSKYICGSFETKIVSIRGGPVVGGPDFGTSLRDSVNAPEHF